jgi:hypothetical protein
MKLMRRRLIIGREKWSRHHCGMVVDTNVVSSITKLQILKKMQFPFQGTENNKNYWQTKASFSKSPSYKQ